jgi:hypothetical protein
MQFRKSLEIDDQHYLDTLQVLITNGSKVSEHRSGSRRTIYADRNVCGYSKTDYNLPLSADLKPSQFYAFLGAFKKSLYRQFRLNENLYNLKIEFDGTSREKNYHSWSKIKSRTIFYNIDLSSAYWQMAFRLGYISKKLFLSYIDRDEFKEAKRYCVSFLARENEMKYFDGRELDVVECNVDVFHQVYDNIRYELYNCIDTLKSFTDNWVEYNIDGISVPEKDKDAVCKCLDEMNLIYKVNECIKIDKNEYFQKGQIRKF